MKLNDIYSLIERDNDEPGHKKAIELMKRKGLPFSNDYRIVCGRIMSAYDIDPRELKSGEYDEFVRTAGIFKEFVQLYDNEIIDALDINSHEFRAWYLFSNSPNKDAVVLKKQEEDARRKQLIIDRLSELGGSTPVINPDAPSIIDSYYSTQFIDVLRAELNALELEERALKKE